VSERVLAAELDRALAGDDVGDEARGLADVLRAATEPLAFAVTDDEVEAALARVAPPVRRRVRLGLRPLVAVGVAVAVSLAVLLIARGPGLDVQAKAARAIAATYFFDATVTPANPRLFPATEITGYVDGIRGRAHVHVYSVSSGTIAETVLHENGSVERWLARTNTTLVASSCSALPGGCGEMFDPLGLYARAVDAAGVSSRRSGGGYELRLRVGNVEQIVQVDGTRFLPRSIQWRENRRLVASMRIARLERQPAVVPPDTWTMQPHGGAHVLQVLPGGALVHVLRVRPGKVTPATRWLGRSYRGNRARVADVTLTGGHATRIDYGPIVVWNYGRVIPPQVLQAQNLGVKVFPLRSGELVHVYFSLGGREAAVVSYGATNIAVVSLRRGNLDVVEAVQELTRAGSP
jgi:hypothetical protein